MEIEIIYNVISEHIEIVDKNMFWFEREIYNLGSLYNFYSCVAISKEGRLITTTIHQRSRSVVEFEVNWDD